MSNLDRIMISVITLAILLTASCAVFSAMDARMRTNERFKMAVDAGLECTPVVDGFMVQDCAYIASKRNETK